MSWLKIVKLLSLLNQQIYSMKERKSQSDKKWRQTCKNLVKSMAEDHQRQDITFNELISLLGRHNAKFYSPDQFKKMSKLFTHPHKFEPITLPLQHIGIHSVIEGALPLYLIFVQNRTNASFREVLSPFLAINSHPVDGCVRSFVMLMKRRFGNQINWFKVLGGMTLSVTISTQMFEENVGHIMMGSQHKKCAKGITQHFKEENSATVGWKKFMGIVKEELKKMERNQFSQYTLASKNSQTVFLPSPKKSMPATQQNQKKPQRESFGLTLGNKTYNKGYFNNSRVCSNEKRFTKSIYVGGNKAKTQDSFHLFVQNKKCKIFQRTHTSFSEKERDQYSTLKAGYKETAQNGKLRSNTQQPSTCLNTKKMSLFFQQNNKSYYI